MIEKKMTSDEKNANAGAPTFVTVRSPEELPAWAQLEHLVSFLHTTMKPWEDTTEDIQRALDYCFSEAEGKGGFMILAGISGQLSGAIVMLRTGMGGYVPPYILLFISVDPELRGRGLGGQLIQRALAECPGDVKLHVEYENPARRLYERVGFTSKYAEMRYQKP